MPLPTGIVLMVESTAAGRPGVAAAVGEPLLGDEELFRLDRKSVV